MAVSGVAGYVGLINDPAQLPWLWPALLSLAGAVFPMILVLIGTHTSTPAGAAALSGFAQSVGYVLAPASVRCWWACSRTPPARSHCRFGCRQPCSSRC